MNKEKPGVFGKRIEEGPLTIDELIDTACEACGCDDPDCGLSITARCHPDAGLIVKFFKTPRVLVAFCRQCDAFVEAISLAQEKPS